MFKKKPIIKPLAPIRSSDRRKIADQIITEFQIEVPRPSQGEDTREQEEPGDSLTIGALRNSLLPENSQSARFTTTAGADLRKISGTVYAGAFPDGDQRILWFRLEEKLVPTVYTLWKHPGLVPLLHTVDFVVDKLHTGSPLMIPGLAGGPPFPKRAVKDAVVAIASVDNPSVPKVVGICEIDISTLTQVQGVKGHAVRSEHWDGDEAWAWSPSGRPGAPPPERLHGWLHEEWEHDLAQETGNLKLEDNDDEEGQDGVSLTEKSNAQREGPSPQEMELEDANKREEVDLSTKEIDDGFWRAFLYAIHQSRESHKSEKNYGYSFPIPQSLVISNMVLPYLPIHTPKQAAALQIKKTTWKNPKKFIKALEKAKILKSKDRDGGECVVVDIDFDDPAVTRFVPYKLPKKSASGVDSGGGDGVGKSVAAGTPSNDPSIGQRLRRVELLRPKEILSPIFENANASTGKLYLPSELRPIIDAYLQSEELLSSSNKRLVNLNPFISNTIFDGKSKLDREVVAKGSVPRDALVERIKESCAPFYVILQNDESQQSRKPVSGLAPKIQIVLETRSGNKTMTKVSGVEIYHINPTLLADELRKTCASSTSVGQLVGSSPKHPVMEILVQGPQNEAVIKAVERRGVQRSWISSTDKTKRKR